MIAIHDNFGTTSEYEPYTSGDLDWAVEELADRPRLKDEIEAFLHSCQLDLDGNIGDFITVRSGRQLVACAGMGENVIKCVAVSPALRGQNITTRLITEVTLLAVVSQRTNLAARPRFDGWDR